MKRSSYCIFIFLIYLFSSTLYASTGTEVEVGLDLGVGYTFNLEYNFDDMYYFYGFDSVVGQTPISFNAGISTLIKANDNFRLGGEISLRFLGVYDVIEPDYYYGRFQTNSKAVIVMNSLGIVRAEAGRVFFMLGIGGSFVYFEPRLSWCAGIGFKAGRGSFSLPWWIRVDQIVDETGFFWGGVGSPITISSGFSFHYVINPGGSD